MLKKIVIGIVCVLVLSMTIFSVKSKEFFVKVKLAENAKPVSNQVETTTSTEPEKTVRIVLKGNNYTTIYHSEVSVKSEKLNIYYGEKYKSKKNCKKICIEKDDKYFKKNNVIKIEASSNISWEKDESSENPTYPGMFYIYNTTSGLVVVNEVNMEDYIASVIASEIGEDSPEEALKAQAVCARTYIVNANAEEYDEFEADGDDSTSYQVYNRVETGEKCKKAANATKNLVMKYKNKTINAYYFSTSCGYTTDYKIWGRKKQKYLEGCCTLKKQRSDITDESNFAKFIKSTPKSYEDDYPFYRWNVYVSNEQVQNAISNTAGVDVGYISQIKVNERGTGGIVSQMTVYGNKRQLIMNNQNQIRKALCSYYAEIKLNDGSVRTKMDMLPSAFISIENVYEEGSVVGFKMYGGGFGHGSGMSQNGAREMAKQGKTYEEILKKYYNGIKIGPL